MGKPQENKKPDEKKGVVAQAIAPIAPLDNSKPLEQNSVDAKNALDSFINSDNTDIDNKKDEAKLNDFIDEDGKSDSEEIPKNLQDLPRKYWKHQTV